MFAENASGERVDKNDTHFYQNDNYSVVVSLDTTKMSQGIYTASWQVTDTLDFGTTNGTFQFGVDTVVCCSAYPDRCPSFPSGCDRDAATDRECDNGPNLAVFDCGGGLDFDCHWRHVLALARQRTRCPGE